MQFSFFFQKPVNFSTIARPACLPKRPFGTFEGADAVASGWGRTINEDLQSFAGILQKLANMKVGRGGSELKKVAIE